VLRHVREEELLLAKGIERRGEREDGERKRRREARLPPGGHGSAAPRERARAAEVQERDEGRWKELKRVERPARDERRSRLHLRRV
jgi:hypothetical protein